MNDLACKVLGLSTGRRIDPLTPLQEFGLDSLMAVELRNAIAGVLGKPLPATFLFSYPSLEEVTTYVCDQFGVQRARSAAAAAGIRMSGSARTVANDVLVTGIEGPLRRRS